MTDNFNSIRQLLEFDSKEDFYFLQIIKRKKDNPDLPKSEKLIDNFFIYSIEELDKLEGKIKDLCNMHNARACLRINRRNSRIIHLQTSRILAELLISENYRAAANAYISAAGKYSSEPKKKWLIDIDPEDLNQIDEIRETIKNLHYQTEKTGYKIIAEIPSKSGIHIITNPFNLMEFKKKFPNIDIHKDNMCILYCP